MEISLITTTITTPLSLSSPHISAAVAPPPRKPSRLRRTLLRRLQRTRRRSDPGSDSGGFSGGGDDGGGDDGGGGPSGGGGGWSSGGWGGWERDPSPEDPAFDFVYGVMCWIALSNCLHFAFKKVSRVGGEREKIRLAPVC